MLLFVVCFLNLGKQSSLKNLYTQVMGFLDQNKKIKIGEPTL